MFNVKSLDLEPHGFTGITLNDFKAGLYVNYEIASLLLHMLNFENLNLIWGKGIHKQI
jgi:hypothetical protein